MLNIAGTDGSVMVPVVSETGALMAWLLYPDPLGTLQEYYPHKSIPRAYTEHTQSIPSPYSTEPGTGRHGSVRLPASSLYKNFHSWAGQLFIQSLKRKNMATESSKGVSADRIKNDPLFERTRENMAEFARAGKAAKLMRTIFREVMIYAKDKITQARLVKVFSRVLSADPVSARGERTVGNGDLLQLQHFNFNVRAGLTDTLYARCPVSINRVTGQATVSIPAFVPRIMVQGPRGTTHFKVVAAAAAINFDTEAYEYVMQGTPELAWDHAPTVPSTLSLALPANSPDTIVVALGIEFYQRVNSRSYALKTGECNATSVVKVDVPPPPPPSL